MADCVLSIPWRTKFGDAVYNQSVGPVASHAGNGM